MEKTISRTEFINKYKSIFDELQLEGMEYHVEDVEDGDIIAIVNYTLTYHTGHETEDGNDLIYEMEIVANRVEGRWTIEWSPKLIFPMMDWGDTVRVGVLQSKRGEILCDGVPYAQNVNLYTVYAVPSSVDAAAADRRTCATTAARSLRRSWQHPGAGRSYKDVMKALNTSATTLPSSRPSIPTRCPRR